MTKKERRRRSAKESSREKNFQWLVERADRHLSGKRHEINERSKFMNDPAKRRRRRWSGVSDMNDREKAGTSERRNEGVGLRKKAAMKRIFNGWLKEQTGI